MRHRIVDAVAAVIGPEWSIANPESKLNVSLLSAPLHYGGGLQLHTASSGSVTQLDALYLIIEDASGIRAIGETRLNIAYLNGLAADYVIAEAVAMIKEAPWTLGAGTLLDDFDAHFAQYCAPVRMLVDIALHDWAARLAGVSVAEYLALRGQHRQRGQREGVVDHTRLPLTWATNQTLFWSSDEVMLARAEGYVARGFYQLKLRVGVAGFEDDVRRIDLLRARFGDDVTLSADANGQWSYADAPYRLDTLARRGLAYIEQPVPAGNWDALAKLAVHSPLTIMLDESLQSSTDVMRLCQLAHLPLAAHLKLVKLGGLAATVQLARSLQAAHVPLMIGQMNEGAISTAAALHACVALGPQWSELYGADGLTDDPASGLVYDAGGVRVAGASGLGVEIASAGRGRLRPITGSAGCHNVNRSKESFNA